MALDSTKQPVVQEKYTNSFLGFGPEDQDYFSLELTYNYGKDSYDLGNQFGHFALAVPDVYKTVEKIKAEGASPLSAVLPILKLTHSLPDLGQMRPWLIRSGSAQ